MDKVKVMQAGFRDYYANILQQEIDAKKTDKGKEKYIKAKAEGLRFIDRNRKFFLKNPRLSMMVRIFDKMKADRKKLILSEADKFIKTNTYGN